jgi:uncharacterized protein (DUF1330 family)
VAPRHLEQQPSCTTVGLSRAGAKFVVGGESRWANEATGAWAVLEYPSLEAILQKYNDLEGKLNCFRYWACDTYLGVWLP